MHENETRAAMQYQAGPVEVTLAGMAVVGVKLMGLYALLLGIPHVTLIPSIFLMTRSASMEMWLSYALPGAAYLAAGVVLLFGAEGIVARVLRVTRGSLPPTEFDQRFQAMAFSLLGVLLIVWGGAALAQAVANYILEQSLVHEGLPSAGLNYSMLVEPTVEILAGLALFLGGAGLAGLWHRMRYGGVRVRAAD
ncbi:MAG TPA: hypothetical protein VGR35_15670 [Tepidisphaeraceae bacterium]|nr:hypothetical protein [Tepidisphaeraceae bacterium]